MRKWLITMLLGVLGTASAQSTLSNFFEHLQTFSGRFEQLVKQDGQIVQCSSGKVKLKKPLKFSWLYEKPDALQLISDGQRFFYYDVDLAQVTVKPIAEVAGFALMQLISNQADIDKLFVIKSLERSTLSVLFPAYADAWKQQANRFYILSPKKSENDGQIKTIVVGLSAHDQLRLFYVRDVLGENVFSFSFIEQNQTIDDSTFIFKAPEGVDVLE